MALRENERMMKVLTMKVMYQLCNGLSEGGIIHGDNKMGKEEYQSHNDVQNEIGVMWSVIIVEKNVMQTMCPEMREDQKKLSYEDK